MARKRAEYTFWWWVGLPPALVLFRACFSWKVRRVHRIPPEGPILVAANHMSFLDPVFIAMAIGKTGRIVRFLAAAEFFGSGFVGWVLKVMQQIPLRRGQRDEKALDAAKAALREGSIVGIFPEGGINDHPETLKPGKRGVARLAVEANVPILPVGVWGPQHRLPRGGVTKHRPFRSRVSIVFGEPIQHDPTDESEDALDKLTQQVMVEIERLRDLAREDVLRRGGVG